MPTETEIARLDEFMKPPLIAVMATVGVDGMPQVTPVWCAFQNGGLVISITKELLKYRNLVRDPRLSVCVYRPPVAKAYVTLTGTAELTDDESIWGPTRAICEKFMPPEDVGPWVEKLRAQNRVLITLRPDRIVYRDLGQYLPDPPLPEKRRA